MEKIDNKIKYEGELDLNGLKIPCYVLEDGRRVLSTTGMQNVLGLDDPNDRSGTKLVKILSSKAISDCIPNGYLSVKDKSFPCFKGNRRIMAYEATILPDICEIMLNARDCALSKKTSLGVNQQTVINRCDIIVRALAKVGIIALVDEATGYQEDKNRAKDELQKFLNQFLTEEASKWVKTFNDSFFEMIYKMRGWDWENIHKRPAVVGQWINDIVYKRLGPGVLEELKVRNPKNEKGYKPEKDHQFLSEDLGKPKLKEHLAAIEALGRASDYNWDKFKEMLDKALPVQDKLYDEIMRGECGDPNIEEDMKRIAKGIFSYNPKTDPNDPLFDKTTSKKGGNEKEF